MNAVIVLLRRTMVYGLYSSQNRSQKSLRPTLNSTYYTVFLLPSKYYRQKISQQTAAATSYHAIIFRETALAEFGIYQDL